jgi:hypothetical protein
MHWDQIILHCLKPPLIMTKWQSSVRRAIMGRHGSPAVWQFGSLVEFRTRATNAHEFSEINSMMTIIQAKAHHRSNRPHQHVPVIALQLAIVVGTVVSKRK